MKKVIKYGLLIPGWFILSIAIIVVLAGLLIQTQPAKRKIASIVEHQTSHFMNGNLSIGKIDGNFFTHLSLKNVVLTLEQDTLAHIDEIKAHFNLWPLLYNTLEVHSAEIIHPRLFVKQINDSTWNIQQILKPVPENTDSSSSGSFNISLPVFRITNGFISTEAVDPVIPRKIENLNTELSVLITENEQKAQLKKLSFSTSQPDFTLAQLEFLLTRNDKFIELKDFRLQTAKNQLSGKAGFNPEEETGTSAFEIPALQLEEFSFFLPSLKFPATPKINFSAGTEKNITQATIELEDENQKIYLHLTSENLADFLFRPNETELSYSLTGKFENVELVHWLGNQELPYTINGEISAVGRGTDPATARLNITGQLNNWLVQDEQPDKLLFYFSLNNGNLTGQLQGKGKFGSFILEPSVQNLLNLPVYSAKLTTQNLDLQRLTGIESLNSNLNMTAQVKGREFDPGKITVAGQIIVLNSRFQHIQFDTLYTAAQYSNQNILLDSLRAKTQTVLLTANGNYSLKSQSDLKLFAEITGLEEFSAYMPDINLETNGMLRARLWGKPDSLSFESVTELGSTRYDEITIEKIKMDAAGYLTQNDTVVNGNIIAFGLRSGNLKVDSVAAHIEGTPDSLFLTANLAARDLNTQIETGIVPGEQLKFTIADWKIDFKNQKWALQQPPAIIEIGALNYYVENFRLESGNAESLQTIFAEGQISRESEEDFILEITALNMGNFGELFEMEEQISGLLDVHLKLKGNPDALDLTTDFSLKNPGYNGFNIREITGKMGYVENRFKIDALVLPADSGKIEITAVLPLQLNLDTLVFDYNLKDTVTGLVTIEKFSLAMLEALEITNDIEGFMEAELELSGTVESPVLAGKYALNDAAFSGYRFLTFDGSVNYSNNLFSAETLVIPQDSGKFELSASLPLHYNPDSLSFSLNPKDSISGSVLIEKFTLAILQAMNPAGKITGQLEGELSVSGTVESPNPTGNLRLTNTSVEMREYGINYSDIGLNLNFLRDKIRIDNLLVKSRDGNLTGTGQIDFTSDFYKGDISQSEIELKFNRFQPFNHRQFNMQVNGNATLGGKKGEVIYGGDITIPQSEIFIPAIMRMLGKMTVPEMPKPLLVQELEDMELLADSFYIEQFGPQQADSARFGYLDNFKGNLRIRIPRNTWIKNDDMYIEISGDVELRKNNEYFELFGSVNVVRGQYDMLGKTFRINEGSISFRGGEQMMPYMDIKASYAFRNPQRVEQNLSVQVSGTTELPVVNFQLDGSPISEGDALSYLLFGKSMNELSIDEQDNMDGAGGGSLAGRAAASILTSQLTNFLGDKLAVDYIEVKSDGGFDNATVVVGKYITNDLFVSYEQRFGETHEKDMAKYEVKLEYELFRFLFFELNNSSRSSGFDVIFKFDVK